MSEVGQFRRANSLPGYRPLTPALNTNRPPHTPVYLHLVHPSGVPWTTLPMQHSSRNQDPAVDYFYSAAKHRSRGVLWPIFTPALIPAPSLTVVSLFLVFRCEQSPFWDLFSSALTASPRIGVYCI
jgi:hypothetical protein